MNYKVLILAEVVITAVLIRLSFESHLGWVILLSWFMWLAVQLLLVPMIIKNYRHQRLMAGVEGAIRFGLPFPGILPGAEIAGCDQLISGTLLAPLEVDEMPTEIRLVRLPSNVKVNVMLTFEDSSGSTGRVQMRFIGQGSTTYEIFPEVSGSFDKLHIFVNEWSGGAVNVFASGDVVVKKQQPT